MNRFNLYIIAITFTSLYGCEDVVDLDLESGKSQLVVDAFLTNDSSVQQIRLTKSADYFLNERTPAENQAKVEVVGPNNQRFVFVNDGNGNFTYDPRTNGPFDSTGYSYKLELEYMGVNYVANSTLNPVPQIDTMTYAFEEASVFSEAGYYTQFFAVDFAGRKDYYWIRAYKNGTPIYEDPSLLILAEDGSFGGDGADGFPFILPIRSAITNEEEPFQIGDISSVEVLSLSSAAFEFVEQVTVQANNGGLFSTPPSNIRTNILDASGSLQEEVLGVFSLSSISRDSIQIK